MDPGTSSRVDARVVVGVTALVLALGAVVTWQSRSSWFAGDDLQEIRRAIDPGGLGDPPRLPHWRPLTDAWLRLDHRSAGSDATRYHLGSVAVHVLDALLVGWVAHRATVRAGAANRAGAVGGLAAIVFVALPTHSEAVSWISARGDLVAAAGALVAVGICLGHDRPTPLTAAAGAAALAAGLAAKEQAVATPLVALVLVVATDPDAPGRRSLLDAVRRVVPLLAVVAAYLGLRTARVGALVGSYAEGGGFDLHPLRTPARLLVMVARTVVPGGGVVMWVPALLGVVGALALAWNHRSGLRAARHRPLVRVAVGGAAAAAAAALPGVGLGVSLGDPRGERLVYAASACAALGLAAAAVLAWDAAATRGARGAIGAVGVGLILVSIVVAVDRDGRWADAGRLAEDTLDASPAWDGPRPLLLLTTIDDVGGAYAHRNATSGAAVVVHGWDDPTLVTDVVPLRADRIDAEVEVRPIGPRRWSIGLGDGVRTAGVPGGGAAWAVPGVVVERVGPETLEVTLDERVDVDAVWYTSGGELHPMPLS